MRTRAILVGIERYRAGAEVGEHLPGTLANLARFEAWLRERNPHDLDVITVVGDAALGPDSGTVLAAVQEAAARWYQAYDELFVYIAGHGFSYKPLPYSDYQDVLVCSDFLQARTSGRACVIIPELRMQLRNLGPGIQHWFVEICRVIDDDVRVVPSGFVVDRSQLGVAKINTLFATAPGQLQDVGEVFNEAVIEGLRGEGRAKLRDQGRWVVNFQRLSTYVGMRMRERLQRETSELLEDGGRVLVELQQVDKRSCSIVVDGAAPDASFRVTVWSGRERLELGDDGGFAGGQHRIALEPGDYEIDVRGAAGPLQRLAPPESLLDLHRDVDVRFSTQVREVTRGAFGRSATLRVHGLGSTRVRLVGNGLDELLHRDAVRTLAPGEYVAELLDSTGVVATRRVALSNDADEDVDFGPVGFTPVHHAIASRSGGSLVDGVVLSESVGRLDSRDLSVWLGLIGAGRIMGHGQLDELPSVYALPPRGSALLLLSALEGDQAPRSARFVSEAGSTPLPWRRYDALSISVALAELPASTSGAVVLDERWAMTTVLLPDRVTLVTLAPGPDGGLAVRQLALPPRQAVGSLPPGQRFVDAPMQHVKFGLEAQGRFLAHQPVMPRHGSDFERKHWELLSSVQWQDPVMTLVTAFELLRDGELRTAQPRSPELAASNLRAHFGSLPDVTGLELLLRSSPVHWSGGMPLLQEAFQLLRSSSFPLERWLERVLPSAPADDPWIQDMSSPWTSWVRRGP
jgi:hypothetical protein